MFAPWLVMAEPVAELVARLIMSIVVAGDEDEEVVTATVEVVDATTAEEVVSTLLLVDEVVAAQLEPERTENWVESKMMVSDEKSCARKGRAHIGTLQFHPR